MADGTDVYAFVSPDQAGHRHADRQLHPAAEPDGGPNFYEFGDDVAYEIKIANSGQAKADIVYRFRFATKIRNPKTFLYNTGQITTHRQRELEPAAALLGDPDRGRQQQE